VPVAVLAIGTLLSGFLAIGFGVNQTFGDWLANAAPTMEPSTSEDVVTTAIAWAMGAAGGVLAWRAYAQPGLLERLKRPFGRTAAIAEHKFYWDELYDAIAYIPAAALAVGIYRIIERWVVWGTVDLVAFLVRMLARGTADAQTGVVRQYATVLVAGAAVLGVYFLSRATL
jgi:NADH-quinone oxidoreductase subunit L